MVCGPHAVRQRLDERRAAAFAGPLQRRLRHGVTGEDVVAVDLDARQAEAVGPLDDGDGRCRRAG